MKVKYKVTINNKLINEVGGVMSKMDLGIAGLEKKEVYNISWNTTSEVDKKYLKKMKAKLKESFEKQGAKVLDIVKI